MRAECVKIVIIRCPSYSKGNSQVTRQFIFPGLNVQYLVFLNFVLIVTKPIIAAMSMRIEMSKGNAIFLGSAAFTVGRRK